MRRCGEHYAVLDRHGQISEASSGTAAFGHQLASFAPEQAVAIAPDESDVLLAGPDGRAFTYNFSRGTFRPLGSEPISNGRIVALENTPMGYLARFADSKVFTFDTDSDMWNQLEGRTGWTVRDEELWLLDDKGIVPPATWGEDAPDFLVTGADARDLVSQASFVWQSSDNEAVFFTRSGRCGVYDIASDSFATISSPLKAPTQFASSRLGVAIRDGMDVYFLRRTSKRKLAVDNYELKSLGNVPPGRVSLAVGQTFVRAAYLSGQHAEVRTWQLSGGENTTVSIRGGQTGPGFPLNTAKWAKFGGDNALLVDHRGECISYDLSDGRWQLLRQAHPGQSLVGYAGSGVSEALLLSSHGGKKTVVVPLAGMKTGHEKLWPVGPSALHEHLKQRRTQFKQNKLTSLLHAEIWEAKANELESAEKLLESQAGVPKRFVSPQLEMDTEGSVAEFRLHNEEAQVFDGGFRFDHFDDIVLDDQGEVWGLSDNRLRHYVVSDSDLIPQGETKHARALRVDRLANGQFRLLDAEGHKTFLSATSGASSATPHAKTLASLPLGDLQLVWQWQSENTISVEWRRGDQPLPKHDAPIWSDDGRFASQSIADIALADDRTLIVATELGVVLRDRYSFAPRDVLLDFKSTRLLKTHGVTAGTWAFPRGRRSHVWTEQRFEPADAPRSVISDGYWDWRMSYSSAQSGSLEVAAPRSPKHLRKSHSTESGWRFRDDQVNWIARTPFNGDCWLATHDGLWRFNLDQGRLADEPRLLDSTIRSVRTTLDGKLWQWKDLEGRSHRLAWTCDQAVPEFASTSGEFTVQNEAFRCVYQEGTLEFRARDDPVRPVFENGKFFFDNPSAIVGLGDQLFLLVSGRCLLQRDSRDPVKLLACWPLPNDVEADTHRLVREGEDVLLEPVSATGTTWQLNTSRNARWEPRPTVAYRLDAQSGPVAWLRERGGYSEPWLLPSANESYRTRPDAHRFQDWWVNDRFSWTSPTSCKMLGKRWAVFATPAGTVVFDVSRPDVGPISRIWPQPVQQIDVAQPTGTVIGVVAVNGAEEFLVDEDTVVTAGHLSPASESYRRRAVIAFEIKGDTLDQQALAAEQSWETLTKDAEQPLTSGDVLRLRGRLEKSLPQRFLTQNRFLFDRADLMCGIGQNPSRWLSFTRLQSGPVMQLHELQGTGSGRLILRQIWNVNSIPQFARIGEQLTVHGAFRSTHDEAWKIGELKFDSSDTDLTWQRIESPSADVISGFQIGREVQVDVPSLTWSEGRALYAWDRRSASLPWKVSPEDFSLFVNESGGVALSFDIFRSLAIDRKRSQIAIGTRGGVLRGEFIPHDGRRSIANASLLLSLTEVARLRNDSAGNLHATSATPSGHEHMRIQKESVEIVHLDASPEQRRLQDLAVPGMQATAKRLELTFDAAISSLPTQSDDSSLFSWAGKSFGDRRGPITRIRGCGSWSGFRSRCRVVVDRRWAVSGSARARWESPMIRRILTAAVVVILATVLFLSVIEAYRFRQKQIPHEQRIKQVYQALHRSSREGRWDNVLKVMSPNCRQAFALDVYELVAMHEELSGQVPPVGLPSLANPQDFQQEIERRPELLAVVAQYVGKPILTMRELTNVRVELSLETARGVEKCGSEVGTRTIRFVRIGKDWVVEGISR